MVDTSGSITERDEYNWDRILKFLADVTTLFFNRGDVKVAVVSFSDYALVDFLLEKYVSLPYVIAGINNIMYQGGKTDIAAALKSVRENVIGRKGDRPEAPNIVILITDGIPNLAEQDTIPQANLLKQTGAKIVTVGITDAIDPDMLRQIATDSANFISSPDFTTLGNVVERLFGVACPVPTPTPGLVFFFTLAFSF